MTPSWVLVYQKCADLQVIALSGSKREAVWAQDYISCLLSLVSPDQLKGKRQLSHLR